MELYRRKSGFSTEGFKDFGAVVGFQVQDLVAPIPEGSLGLLRMNYRKKIT